MFRSRQLVADANLRLRQKNLPAAAEAALAARNTSPENDEAWVVFAAIEVAAGRKPSALDALRRAIELNPANKRRVPENRLFEALFADPEFRRSLDRRGAPTCHDPRHHRMFDRMHPGESGGRGSSRHLAERQNVPGAERRRLLWRLPCDYTVIT